MKLIILRNYQIEKNPQNNKHPDFNSQLEKYSQYNHCRLEKNSQNNKHYQLQKNSQNNIQPVFDFNFVNVTLLYERQLPYVILD